MEKPADKPAETASVPADTRRRAPAMREREKVIAKPVAAPAAPSVAAAPVVAAPAAAEAAAAPEEHRDANELARAAIERLRSDGLPRPQEAARTAETPRIVSAPPAAAPVVSAPAVRPLPPPIMVSTPGGREPQRADGIHGGRCLRQRRVAPSGPAGRHSGGGSVLLAAVPGAA